MKSLPALLLLVAAPALQAASPEQEAQPADGGWPRVYDLAGGDSAVLYQPQVASWDGRKHLVAWAAVSYQAQGAQQAVPGTIQIDAETRVALDERLVSFSPFRITGSSFPSLSQDQAGKIVTGLQQAVLPGDPVIALDRVLANLDKSLINPKARQAAGLKADPPRIFSSLTPAIIVNFDGQPVWSPIRDNDLQFAVNTNWDIFQAPSKVLYLLAGDSWLQADDLRGPWAPAGQLPAGFGKLPADDNWKNVKARLPGKPAAARDVPAVFVSFEPAELILIDGAPRYTAVAGTSLLWVSNTESDLFRLGKTGPFYYLVAGRWFSAPSAGGPWTFATTSLPEDFRKIPVDHPRSRVLASVPGTAQAAEAVLLAQIPQTARVNRNELKAQDVVYQGEPELEPIAGTPLHRAVNTDKDVLKAGDLYYLCFQGVWFVSQSAKGPWEVTGSVPEEIYSIPASSPAYHVTYVTVEDAGDDWVTFAADAGYTGMMIAWGCAVWGTGWHYPPYVGYDGSYPVYFWYPPTYGFASWYNPYTGTFGRGAAVYGPYGGADAWAVYNSRTRTYARGGVVYGSYGSRSFAQAWNPRTGTYEATRQGAGVYGNWDSRHVQPGDDWARTGHVTNRAAGARTGSGDVYAGHDGNVYRKPQDRSWEAWRDGGWSPAERPQSTARQLDRDWDARHEGARRMHDSQSYRQGGRGGRMSAGSFRGGGRRP
ncbi:MAG TPA: hypothetical protein VMW27_18025 [Thermoanaerobaculia bacterium]|nr:hypothetical protein [Thermoanaerobaculia bacterium]